MTNERWLKWTVARHHRSHDYKVSMKPVRTGNAMVDGIALGTDGDRIAIEVKPPSDDIIRGIRPCYEAICAGYAHGCGRGCREFTQNHSGFYLITQSINRAARTDEGQ